MPKKEPAGMTKNETPPQTQNLLVEELLFKQVARPKGVQSVKVTNVFDNRYRINVWVRVEENGLEKNKIHSSYFAHLNGDELAIAQGL